VKLKHFPIGLTFEGRGRNLPLSLSLPLSSSLSLSLPPSFLLTSFPHSLHLSRREEQERDQMSSQRKHLLRERGGTCSLSVVGGGVKYLSPSLLLTSRSHSLPLSRREEQERDQMSSQLDAEDKMRLVHLSLHLSFSLSLSLSISLFLALSLSLLRARTLGSCHQREREREREGGGIEWQRESQLDAEDKMRLVHQLPALS